MLQIVHSLLVQEVPQIQATDDPGHSRRAAGFY